MICACNNEATEIGSLLNGIETYIEEHPEEALKVLESVNREELTTRKLKAKHSLLYSMALDKNYIDVTNDSIIAPAVNYYKYRGTDEERFKSLYYAGRVYQNAGDIEKAMEKFVEAERYISNQVDKKIVARLYKAKMVAYRDVFDYQSALEQAQTAARYYLSAKDSIRYLNAVNDIAVLYSQLDDHESEEQYLEILLSNMHLLNTYQISNYYAILLNRSLKDSSDVISKALSDYLLVTTDKSSVDWLCVTQAYIVMQDYQSALISLENHVQYKGNRDTLYYWTAANLYEKLGEYHKALSFFKEYLYAIDSLTLKVFNNDAKYIEERFNAEIKAIRQNLSIIIISLTLIIIALLLVIIYQRMKKVKEEKRIQKIRFDEERKVIVGAKEQVEAQYVLLKEEKEETERMFASLKAEIEQLKKIRKDKSIDKDILASVEQRLNVLNMFILAELSDSFEKIAYNELGKLMENREEFLESTRKTFMISHPKFMAYLRKQNLTEWEIGCCCLYCIGFNGAEISEYLNRKAIYNVNSTIRQKLNIPKGGTQIDVFLQQKLKEFHP
jgi:tetratricopeptide (TPR) repeat protein